MEPMNLVSEEPPPMCISTYAKLNIDDATLSYFGYGCEKFQFLSTGSNTAHWKFAICTLAIGEHLELYIQATAVAYCLLVRDICMT